MCCSASQVLAQQPDWLYIQFTDTTLQEQIKIKDSSQVQKILQDKWIYYLQNGYLTYAIDSTKEDAKGLHIYCYLGSKFVWDNLQLYIHTSNVYTLEPKLKKQWLELANQNLDAIALSQWMQTLLKQLNDQGYPLSYLQFENVSINKTKIKATLRLNTKSLLLLHSIQNVQQAPIKNIYLERYLGFKHLEQYDQRKINRYYKALQRIPFLTQNHPPKIEKGVFENTLQLFLKTRRINKFSLLIALLPNSAYQNKLEVNGEGNIALKNVFKYGESLELSFRKITTASNEFKFYSELPFIPMLPIGADASIRLFKKDSTFVERSMGTGLRWSLGFNNYTKIKWNTTQAILLNIDTNAVIIRKKLPAQLDYVWNNVGLEWNINTTEPLLNPLRGWQWNAEIKMGQKNIKVNNQIASLSRNGYDYNSLYDSIKLKFFQMNGQSFIEKFTALGSIHTVRTKLEGGLIQGSKIATNEFFRLGGFAKLRGFDEDVFVAQWYSLVTLEYRLLLGELSHAFAFADMANISPDLQYKSYWKQAYGLGFGMQLETKGGIFSFSYAQGKVGSNRFQFRNSKIHFGYINYF